MQSPKYKLNQEDLAKILQTIAWTTASALIAAIIAAVQAIDVPEQWLFIVPVVNSLLYALHRFVKGRSE